MTLLKLAAVPVALTTMALAAGCGSTDNVSDAAQAPAPKAAATPALPAALDASSGAATIKTTEFAFAPSAITAKPGKLKLTLDNQGKTEHELVLLKTTQAAGKLAVKGGRVSEDASVGEISETAAGASKSHTFDLKAGTYVLVCNIAGHYQGGMFGTLTVK